MAIHSHNIKLSYNQGSGSTFTDLTNLLSIPELGGSVNKIDITTLGDASKKNMNGLKDYGDVSFTFLFDKAQFDTLNALVGSVNWKVTFPVPAGSSEAGLTATFSGEPSVKISGVGVDARVEYVLAISCDSDIVFA